MIRRSFTSTGLAAVLAAATVHTMVSRTVSASEPECAVVQVKHLPAADLADAINNFLAHETAQTGERVAGEQPPSSTELLVVPVALSNSLLVRGRSQAVQRIGELISELDRKPRSVFVEVVIVVIESAKKPKRVVVQSDEQGTADAVVEALSAQGEVRVLARTQLLALSNQAAYVQVGQGKPRVTGVTSTGRGTARQVSIENVGLVLGLTPRVSPDDTVTLEVDLERSEVDPASPSDAESAGGGPELPLSVTQTLSLKTTVCARDAQTIALGGMTMRQGKKWRRLVALLTPQIID